MTTCRNCYTNKDCQTCPERSRINETLDIENKHAEKSLEELPCWIMGVFLVVVAVGLIVATGIYL
jgi:hypothetical protein